MNGSEANDGEANDAQQMTAKPSVFIHYVE